MAAIAMVAIHGLDIGKWLHNIGSILILAGLCNSAGATHLGFASRPNYLLTKPVPWQMPKLNWFGIAIFGQMTVGALSGFEYVAILAGETRSAARTIGQSVMISAPIICPHVHPWHQSPCLPSLADSRSM